MTALHLSPDLALPLETVTQAIGVIAKRRAGKSYTGAVLTEQVLQAGQQVVIVDPKGDLWGLRSSADGTKPGLPIAILGGEHGDIPLEPAGGEAVARFLVEERVSALLDLSMFRKHEVATFMAAFLETLYRLKAKEQFRTPLLLVVDEADAIAPQKPQPGEQRMLGAAEDIVRRGGQRGIGCMMLTQRAAVLNKNVLTQIQILIALRTIAPQDLAAMNDWIDVHGTPEQRRELMDSLPSLPVGTAWVWSPGWPTDEGIFQRVQVQQRQTFDSSATPKPGETRTDPRNLADIDLSSLRDHMAATIEKAKADDPRELRKRIAELQRQLRERPTETKVETIIERVEVPVLGNEDRARLEAVGALLESLPAAFKDTADLVGRVLSAQHQDAPDNTPAVPRVVHAPRPQAAPVEHREGLPAEGVTRPQQRILDALASLEALGVCQPSKSNVAVFADASPTSGAFANNLGRLRTQGLIAYPSGGLVALTDEGRAVASASIAIRSVSDLHEAWIAQLHSGPKERILRAVAARYPQAVTREDLAAATDASPTSGAFANNLGALRSLGLLVYPEKGLVAASELLFPAGLAA